MPYLVYSDYPAKPEEEAKMNEKTDNTREREKELLATVDPHSSPTKPEQSEGDQARNNGPRAQRMNQRWKSLRDKAERHKKLRTKYEKDVFHRCSTLDESYYHFKIGNSAAEKDRNHRNRTQIVAESERRQKREEAEAKRGGKGSESRGTGRKTVPEGVMQHGWTERARAWLRSNRRTKDSQEGKDPTYDLDGEQHWPVLRVNQLWVWVIGKGGWDYAPPFFSSRSR